MAKEDKKKSVLHVLEGENVRPKTKIRVLPGGTDEKGMITGKSRPIPNANTPKEESVLHVLEGENVRPRTKIRDLPGGTDKNGMITGKSRPISNAKPPKKGKSKNPPKSKRPPEATM